VIDFELPRVLQTRFKSAKHRVWGCLSRWSADQRWPSASSNAVPREDRE
jgi:hypothetical protein